MRQPDRRLAAALALACLAGLFVALNAIADRALRGMRVDLTERHAYTLSDGTKATLAQLDEPVRLRLYYSHVLGQRVPSYAVHAERVRELLAEYAARARGRLDVSAIDPAPFSAEEDQALAAGLQAVPINADGDQVFFGLTGTNSTDDQQVIGFLRPEREAMLEYDLTRIIHTLARPHRIRVGVMTALPLTGDVVRAALRGQDAAPFAIMEYLQQLYDVRIVPGDAAAIPDDLDVLMIVHPKAVPEATEYAIDQYVLRGGRAMLFVDPLSEYEQRSPAQIGPAASANASNLPRLMAAWGVAMDAERVVTDRQAARRVNAGGSSQVRGEAYLGWLGLRAGNFNHADPITADLKLVNVATPGAIEALPGARTALEPLLSTSLASMRLPAREFRGRPDFAALLARFAPEGRSHVIAGRVTGPAATAFPDGPPAGAADTAGRRTASTQPIDVIVVADTDLLDDRFWVKIETVFGRRVAEPVASNGDFVTNAIEAMAGGADLASLRGRGEVSRPFDVLVALQRDAESRYSAEEHRLEDRLRQTREKLAKLETRDGKAADGADAVQAGEEQGRTLDDFRADLLRTRRELRAVRRALREDVDRLGEELAFVDIAAVPLLVGAVAVGVGLWGLRRRRRAQAAGR